MELIQLDASRLNRETLQEVALNTGGAAVLDNKDAVPALDRIFEENASYYVLGYESLSGTAAVRCGRLPGIPEIRTVTTSVVPVHALRGPRRFIMPSTSPSVAAAFRTTLDLFDTGVELMSQNLRRRHPEATDDVIEQLLHEWLHDRPGATGGDCPGRIVDLKTRLA